MAFRYGNFDAMFDREGGPATVEFVRRAIAEAAPVYDDSKIYSTLADFPNPGVPDVIYIADDTGIPYIWDIETEKYEPTRAPITEEEIDDIVKL